MFTGSAETRAIVATTALESTPPERNAPERYFGDHPQPHRFLEPRFSSTQASSIEMRASVVNRTSQYATRLAERRSPRRIVSVCAGGSLRTERKIERGSAT